MESYLIRNSRSICLGLLTLLSLAVWQLETLHSSGVPVTLHLIRGDFKVLEFPAKKLPCLAIVVFASGDGGWHRLEEAISHGLQKQGYDVIGIDSPLYALTDYDLPTLQADFQTIAQSREAVYGDHPPPLIVGGFSMGAAQAIAVAGGPHPPSNLTGLLVVEPLNRGRYGLRTQDKLNVLPTGPGTFAMADFARAMDDLRVVQWHAEQDLIDSRAWLAVLTAEHKEYDFPDTGHRYRNNRDQFVSKLADSAGWLVRPPPAAKMAVRIDKP